MHTKWMIVYRPTGFLNCQTQYIGPFDWYEQAEDELCKLPCIEPKERDVQNAGVKYIDELKPTARAALEELERVASGADI